MKLLVVVAALIAVVALTEDSTAVADNELEQTPLQKALVKARNELAKNEKWLKDASAKLAHLKKALSDADAAEKKAKSEWMPVSKKADELMNELARLVEISRKQPKCQSCKSAAAGANKNVQRYSDSTVKPASMKFQKAQDRRNFVQNEVDGTQRDVWAAQRAVAVSKVSEKFAAQRVNDEQEKKNKKLLFDHTPGEQQTLSPGDGQSLRGSVQ